MHKLPDTGYIYFLGIGGIGMSALARYFLIHGWNVHGYDRTPTTLTNDLIKEGMVIHFDEDINRIPDKVDVVVYTPAIPRDHIEYQHFLNNNIPVVKRAELLGMLSKDYQTIAIAGTHGKTTTSTMAAHIMKQSTIGCQAFLGGISKNYDSNLILTQGSDYLVAEADEFDRSFLYLTPSIAVITSMDADHLDIYGDHETLVETFHAFIRRLIPGGTLILKKGLTFPIGENPDLVLYHYSANDKADFYASSVTLENELYRFDFHYPGGVMYDLVLGLPGLYNVENAVAALSVAWLAGVSESELRVSLRSFEGVKRRFDIRVNEAGKVYIDDYAHHPEELRAAITAARNLYKGKKLTGIFQPHLFSRTRDFADEFARSLELLDEIILLPIYPAREEPIKGINSEMLLDKIRNEHKRLVNKDDLPSCLRKEAVEVILTLGAGDIDTLADPIEHYLKKR